MAHRTYLRSARHRQTIAAIALLFLIVCVLATASHYGHRQINSKVYRIGVDHAPPYYFLRPDGRIEGLAVDTLTEAARRRNIRLRWVRIENMVVDDAFQNDLVDLWPAIASTESRRKWLYLTEPWLTNNFCLIVRRDGEIRTPKDIAHRVIAQHHGPYVAELIARTFPTSIRVAKTSREDVVRAVCTGEAAAGFLEVRFLDTILLQRPQECQKVDFQVHVLKGATSKLCVMAKQSAAPVADELRAAISEMALDGTLSANLEKWSSFSSLDAQSVYASRSRKTGSGCRFMA
jgi:ABC-type amino acid transport substrate-binding protein